GWSKAAQRAERLTLTRLQALLWTTRRRAPRDERSPRRRASCPERRARSLFVLARRSCGHEREAKAAGLARREDRRTTLPSRTRRHGGPARPAARGTRYDARPGREGAARRRARPLRRRGAASDF